VLLTAEEAVEQIELILFEKEAGFSLDEVRKSLGGFPTGTSVGTRWSEMAAAKLLEFDAMNRRIEVMRAALRRISRCGCRDPDQCARGMAAKRCRRVDAAQRPGPTRSVARSRKSRMGYESAGQCSSTMCSSVKSLGSDCVAQRAYSDPSAATVTVRGDDGALVTIGMSVPGRAPATMA